MTRRSPARLGPHRLGARGGGLSMARDTGFDVGRTPAYMKGPLMKDPLADASRGAGTTPPKPAKARPCRECKMVGFHKLQCSTGNREAGSGRLVISAIRA